MQMSILFSGDDLELLSVVGILNAAGKQMVEDLAEFDDYFRTAKSGKPPEVLRVAKKSIKSADWTALAKKSAKRPPLSTLNLTFKGIEVLPYD